MPTFGTTPVVFGGCVIDRVRFRRKLPDDRWYVYAAGLVNPGDGSTATIELVYQKDDNTFVAIGSTTQAGAGEVKKVMGPFSLFDTPGVPSNELIPVIRIRASKSGGVEGTLKTWHVFVELLPSIQ